MRGFEAAVIGVHGSSVMTFTQLTPDLQIAATSTTACILGDFNAASTTV